MKKVLFLTVVVLFVMMPLASFAKTAVSDSDLSTITAQEGVSIYLDNITLTNLSMTMSWGQSSNSSLNLTPTAIVGFPFDQGGFVGAVTTIAGVSVNGLLTIDVGVNNPLLGTSSKGYNNTYGANYIPGGVAIGLNNISIKIGAIQQIIKIGSEETLTNTATTMTLGTFYMSGLSTTVNGTVIISTH
ncbi:MAG: hypothetical protein ACLQBQ_04035 [Smithella sp.]